MTHLSIKIDVKVDVDVHYTNGKFRKIRSSEKHIKRIKLLLWHVKLITRARVQKRTKKWKWQQKGISFETYGGRTTNLRELRWYVFHQGNIAYISEHNNS